MIIDCYAGTPHEGEEKRCTRPDQAKKFVLDRVTRRMKWAEKFDAETHRRLGAVRQEIDGVAISALPLKETRSWSVTDDVSGVTFVFKITRMSSS